MSPVSVEFDEQIFQAQRRGGISRAFAELIRELRARPELGVEVSTPFRWVVNEHLVESGSSRFRRSPSSGLVRGGLNLVDRVVAKRPAVVHHTYYDESFLKAGEPPSVTTVHDMIPELFPDDFAAGNPHLAKRAFVDAADAVICVSETTRRDLLQVYGDVRADVVVVPHGVGDEFRFPRPAHAVLPSRYVLFVGQRGTYKDWRVLIDAWGQVAALEDCALVCLGGGAFTAQEQALLRDAGLATRAVQLAAADSDLPGVYAAAELLVFPSRYEGFGLPILEAFAARCPVVAADTACFREVADDAAVFFEVGDASALASRVSALLGDSALRSSHVEAGAMRASAFTWARTAERTAEVYRSVAR